MLPCIVIDFLLNDQPDALIIQIYSVIKLYMFRASFLCPSSGVFYCTFGIGKFHAGSSVPNRQRKYINIETPERNCTKQTRQYATTKYAGKNSLNPTA
jgi:hypothetical protein